MEVLNRSYGCSKSGDQEKCPQKLVFSGLKFGRNHLFYPFQKNLPHHDIHGWKAMDLSFNLAPSYRDLKDPTSRQNFEDTVEQKRVIDLRACLMKKSIDPGRIHRREGSNRGNELVFQILPRT